jgi:UDP-N-acetylglucosamine--N-acetylmuramyl-(pentapeptide) pyrophosphoryl-undecaprenol N-acetylglucosamine transferase
VLEPASSPRLLLASGGSGGHLLPAVAIAEEWRRRFPNAPVLFVTTNRPVERQICRDLGLSSVELPLLPFSDLKRRPFAFLKAALASRRASAKLLSDWRPHCIVGVGGWGMVPVIQAAARSKTPVVLCEQNILPGRATRWLQSRAATVCVSYEATIASLKAGTRSVVTGNPVRREIAESPPRTTSGLSRLLVVGGSQGARAINHALSDIVQSSPLALAGLQIVHQTGGEESAKELDAAYRQAGMEAVVRPFLVDLPRHYRETDLLIARAGATTLAEAACMGLPAILVPYPFATHDHQSLNAEEFQANGAAVVVSESGESPFASRLAQAIQAIRTAPERLPSMSAAMRQLAKPDAAARVVDVIQTVIRPMK